MAAKKLTAPQQFEAVLDGRTVIVLAGAKFAADDEIAKAYRAHLDPPPTRKTAAEKTKR